MVFCSLCKTNKETKYNWQIADHMANGKSERYKICDECATTLLKEMTGRVMGIRDKDMLPNPMELTKTGLISELLLHEDKSLEIVINLDVHRARRIISKENNSDEK
ncbi:MAG: hypothetical protein J7L23_02515 [Candidatus Diapherotrites archaeon]|nr:hypothetical protein [Candidatus Diapherotrites archaeon]